MLMIFPEIQLWSVVLIFCESAERNPGYVRNIVMYTTCLKDRYVGGSCVNFFYFYHISLNLSIYPGYVRDIDLYITSLEVKYVGGSCVKL